MLNIRSTTRGRSRILERGGVQPRETKKGRVQVIKVDLETLNNKKVAVAEKGGSGARDPLASKSASDYGI